MSLITPHHLYDIPSAATARPPAPVGGTVPLTLFEEAWLQLPRRRQREVSTVTTDDAFRVMDGGQPRA